MDYPNEYDSCNAYVKKIRKRSDKKLRDHVARRNNEKDVERYKVMAENHWNFLELLEYRPDLGHEKSACSSTATRCNGGICRQEQ